MTEEDMGPKTVPDLVNTYVGLTRSVDALTRSNDRRERRNGLVYTLVVVLLVVGIAVPIYIRHLGAGSRESIFRIVDCTTVGGQCFEESNARQKAFLAELIEQNAQTNLQLTVCLKASRTATEVRTCAQQNLDLLGASAE